jgi:hypothetical protein
LIYITAIGGCNTGAPGNKGNDWVRKKRGRRGGGKK